MCRLKPLLIMPTPLYIFTVSNESHLDLFHTRYTKQLHKTFSQMYIHNYKGALCNLCMSIQFVYVILHI